MLQWFETVADRFWLKPDTEGEMEAKFILKALHLDGPACACSMPRAAQAALRYIWQGPDVS